MHVCVTTIKSASVLFNNTSSRFTRAITYCGISLHQFAPFVNLQHHSDVLASQKLEMTLQKYTKKGNYTEAIYESILIKNTALYFFHLNFFYHTN